MTKTILDNNNLRVGRSGFTLVELLIVIVVIAILATIAIIAYRGIQTRAAESVLHSDLRNAATRLGIIKTEDGNYPTDTDVPSEVGATKSDGTHFQYSSTDGSSYCLTATSTKNTSARAFHIKDGASVKEGLCPDHSGPSEGGDSGQGAGMEIGDVAHDYNQGKFVMTSDVKFVHQRSDHLVIAPSIIGIGDSPESTPSILAGSPGQSGYVDGSSTSARFNVIRNGAIAIDSNDNIYVADRTSDYSTYRVRKITRSGQVSTLAGSGIPGSNDGTGSAAQFGRDVMSMEADSFGNIYVQEGAAGDSIPGCSSGQQYRIRKITPKGTVSTFGSWCMAGGWWSMFGASDGGEIYMQNGARVELLSAGSWPPQLVVDLSEYGYGAAQYLDKKLYYYAEGVLSKISNGEVVQVSNANGEYLGDGQLFYAAINPNTGKIDVLYSTPQ